MSDSDFQVSGEPSLQQLVDYFVESLTDPEKLTRIENALANGTARGNAASESGAFAAVTREGWAFVEPAINVFLKALLGVLQGSEGIIDDIGKIAVDAVIGEAPRRGYVPDDVGARILQKLSPASETIEPGTEGAARYLTTVAHLQVETWAMGLIAETFADGWDMLRGAGATLKSVGELRDVMMQVFGGGRITRRVLAPFIDDGIVTPAKWATQKKYRPTLLSAPALTHAIARGQWTIAEATEELARQGFSDRRIAAMIADALGSPSPSQILSARRLGVFDDIEAKLWFGYANFDETVTNRLLALDDAERIDAIRQKAAADAVSAFIAGNVDETVLSDVLGAAIVNDPERNATLETAHVRRSLNVKHVTAAQVRALVLDGIAAVPDYLDALQREGYQEPELTWLELSLRKDQDDQHDLAKAKADKKAADEAKAAQAAADKAAREAELEAKRARTFPSLAEFRRSYVRGFIDRQVYADELAREKYAPDDAAFLLAGADDDRAQFLADQAKAAQAAADHADKGLSVATLEQAVLKGILTLSEFDSTLVSEKVPDDDRALLVKLLQAKIDDQAAAAAKRADADKAAAAKDVSLSTWERAVRLGVRSLAQYSDFLTSIGLTDPARALILDVLGAQLAADTAAKAVRDARDAAAATQGISLAQRRRAVIAGVRPRDYYAQALIAAGWPVDDQLADLDLLDVEIAAHQDAEARRAAIDAKAGQSTLTLAQLDKALGLGLITQSEYSAAVIARGATVDDAALLLQLALAGIEDTAAAKRLHDQVAADLANKGVSLADLESAVRRGLVTLDAFAADLAGGGYGADAVDLLRQLLSDKVGLDVDGLTQKLQAALDKGGSGLVLGDVGRAFQAGETDAAAAQQQLVDAGATRDAALVYIRLVDAGEVEG